MFVIKEEMGFDDTEVKDIVMKKPKLLMLSKYSTHTYTHAFFPWG